MPSPIMKYFEYKHLPPDLQEVSRPIGELAVVLDSSLPDCAEKSAGLRKLLEAKDCMVRAKLDAAGYVPVHLRDDAPFFRCDKCGRKTWGPIERAGICDFPQPGGVNCDGRMVPGPGQPF